MNVLPAWRIVGGDVLTPDGVLEALDVEITGERITALHPRRDRPVAAGDIDATGRIVAPGLIDLQINGGWGDDFTADPASIATVARRLPSTGVSAFVPTIVTAPASRRVAAIEAFAGLRPEPGAAHALGLHFECPAISPARRGAHDARYIGLPYPGETALWSAQAGVAIVTLAPELDGALELIGGLRERGVVVSIGHTACTAERFAEARAAGATLVTHLFNAMAAFDHRAPGPIGATLADPDVAAGLICDGLHLDPVTVAMAWRSLGMERTVLVTDAIAALGWPHGTTILASRPVTVDASGVRTADGVLAGSNLALDQAVRNLVAFTGCAPAHALHAASAVPAAVLGLPDRGRIALGARADVILLDAALNVERTIIGGLSAWKS